MNYLGLKEEFKKLEPIQREFLIFDLLFDGSISYTELSKLYVKALEKQHQIESRRLSKSILWLEQIWNKIPINKRFLRAAASYTILESKVFHGAKIEQKYIDYLKENPYKEDEYGLPKTKLK